MPLLFLTHHKCASNWIAINLAEHARQKNLRFFCTHESHVFPPGFADFDYALFGNASYRFLKNLHGGKAVHVIRNPLAILVSAWFSHKNTHVSDGWPELAAQRQKLQQVDKAEGLELTRQFLERAHFGAGAEGPLHAMMNFDYDDPEILTVRMEDMVASPGQVFTGMFRFLGGEIDEEFLEILRGNTFSKFAGGRVPGQVDETSHYRSGSPSDWSDHVSPAMTQKFYTDHRGFMERFYPGVARHFS